MGILGTKVCEILGFQSVTVTRCVYCREKRLQALCRPARVRAFFNAPVVIFHLNILSYFAFLCLFAYVLMVDFQPSPSWCEYLIYLWLFSLVCEETRQVLTTPIPSVCYHRASPWPLGAGHPFLHLGFLPPWPGCSA